MEVEDFGRGMPVDYNQKRAALQLGTSVLRAVRGRQILGRRRTSYEYSLGLNGLGLCATQYSSEWMQADICRDGFHYHLDFQQG